MNTKMTVIPKRIKIKIIIQNYLTLGISSTNGYKNCIKHYQCLADINLDSAVIHAIDIFAKNENYLLNLVYKRLQSILHLRIIKFKINIAEKKHLKSGKHIKKKKLFQGGNILIPNEKLCFLETNKFTLKPILIRHIESFQHDTKTVLLNWNEYSTLIREFLYIKSVQATRILFPLKKTLATSNLISSIGESEVYDD